MNKRKEIVVGVLVLLQVAIVYFLMATLYAVLFNDSEIVLKISQAVFILLTVMATYFLWNEVIAPKVLKTYLRIKGVKIIALTLGVVGTFNFIVNATHGGYDVHMLLMTFFAYYIAYYIAYFQD
jgi:hypothetical protein